MTTNQEKTSMGSSNSVDKRDFQELIERASISMAVFSMEGKIEYANSPTEALTGYSIDELLGMHFSELVQPAWRDKVVDFYVKQVEEMQSGSVFEFPIEKKNGDKRWVEQTVDLLIENDEIKRVYCIVRDITEVRRAEQKLIESELRYQTLFNQSNDAVLILSLANGEIIDANQEAAHLVGYALEELIGQPASKFIAQEEVADLERVTSELLKGNDVPVYERTVIKKDGTRVKTEINILLVCDKDGVPLYFQSLVRDVSKRKRAEQALLESERRYQTLFNQGNDAVFILSLEKLNVIDVNQRASELLGYSIEEMIGQPASTFISQEEVEEANRVSDELMEKGDVPVYERTVIKKDGTKRFTEVNISLVSDDDGNPIYYQSVVRDITERKEREERFKHLATHDPLTDIPNRMFFMGALARAIARARRHESKLAVFFFDLDDFKDVNDTYGHAAGDEVLVQTTKNLKKVTREEDILARFSGDEFTMIAEGVKEKGDVKKIAEKVLQAVNEPISIRGGHAVKISASLGICIFPDDTTDADELVQFADKAMYAAKGQGRNRYHFYDERMADGGEGG